MNQEKTCCFTGHRPKLFSWGDDEASEEFEEFSARLSEAIDQAIESGATKFICGNALGVDTWAAQDILRRKWKGEDLTLEIAVPFEGHNDRIQKIRDIQEAADEVNIISRDKPVAEAYSIRNNYMVDSSDIVIGVYEDDEIGKGGTGRTVAYAQKNGKELIPVRWRDI